MSPPRWTCCPPPPQIHTTGISGPQRGLNPTRTGVFLPRGEIFLSVISFSDTPYMTPHIWPLGWSRTPKGVAYKGGGWFFLLSPQNICPQKFAWQEVILFVAKSATPIKHAASRFVLLIVRDPPIWDPPKAQGNFHPDFLRVSEPSGRPLIEPRESSKNRAWHSTYTKMFIFSKTRTCLSGICMMNVVFEGSFFP